MNLLAKGEGFGVSASSPQQFSLRSRRFEDVIQCVRRVAIAFSIALTVWGAPGQPAKCDEAKVQEEAASVSFVKFAGQSGWRVVCTRYNRLTRKLLQVSYATEHLPSVELLAGNPASFFASMNRIAGALRNDESSPEALEACGTKGWVSMKGGSTLDKVLRQSILTTLPDSNPIRGLSKYLEAKGVSFGEQGDWRGLHNMVLTPAVFNPAARWVDIFEGIPLPPGVHAECKVLH